MTSNAEIRLAVHAFVTNKVGRDGRQDRYDNDIPHTFARMQRWIETSVKGLRLVKTLAKGLALYCKKGTVDYYILAKSGVALGFVSLSNKHIHTLFIAPEHAGNSYGTVLLEAVLAKEGVLRSSDTLSKGATRLWQKLITKHKGKLCVPVAGVSKPYVVDIVDWDMSGGYAYPVVMRAGVKVSLRTLLKSKGFQEQLSAEKSFFIVRL